MNPHHHLSRRGFLKTTGAAAAAATLGNNVIQAKATEKRPNILIIFTDQQSMDTIAAYKSHFDHPACHCHWVDTPNLDRLARRGTSFMESYSTSPVCSPARSSVFTGRMPTETGVVINNIGIDKNVPNMGQWFEQHSDYQRYYCGKWHAGGAWNYPHVDGDSKIPGFDTVPINSNGTGDFADYQVSTATSAFLRNYDADEPFLYVSSIMNPHDICYLIDDLAGFGVTPHDDTYGLGDALPPLPPNFDYDFKDVNGGPYAGFAEEVRWRNYIYGYHRMVEKVDLHVGMILDAVEARDDDTLILFTSDHGEGGGRHRRVQKWHPYEESGKVPFIISLPGHVREDALDTQHLISGLDVMATVCDYAGIPAPPHTLGHSVRGLAETGKADSWRTSICYEYNLTGRVIRTDQYKFAMAYQQSSWHDEPFVRKSDGEPTAFKQGEGHTLKEMPGRLLFDMKKDPWETKNLADDPAFADVLGEHERILRDDWEAKIIPGWHFDRGFMWKGTRLHRKKA